MKTSKLISNFSFCAGPHLRAHHMTFWQVLALDSQKVPRKQLDWLQNVFLTKFPYGLMKDGLT